MNKNSDDKLSIEFDDDNKNYESFNEFMTSHTKRKKNVFANELESFGDKYLTEISRKKQKNEEKKKKLITYILKHSDNYFEDDLYMYEYYDILDIYNQIKKKKQPVIFKFFQYIFNIQ